MAKSIPDSARAFDWIRMGMPSKLPPEDSLQQEGLPPYDEVINPPS